MKRLRVCVILALCFLVIPASEAAFLDGVKIGTGTFWSDSTRPAMDSFTVGLHVSADFAPVQALVASPFFEIAGGDGNMRMFGGMLSYSIGMRDHEDHRLFLGANGGTTRINGNSAPFYGGHVGYKFPVRERWGLFFIGKYIEADDSEISGISGHVGLVFRPF